MPAVNASSLHLLPTHARFMSCGIAYPPTLLPVISVLKKSRHINKQETTMCSSYTNDGPPLDLFFFFPPPPPGLFARPGDLLLFFREGDLERFRVLAPPSAPADG